MSTFALFQAKYDKAEQLMRESKTIVERNVGPEHPDMVSCLNNLAVVLQLQARTLENLLNVFLCRKDRTL